MMTTAQIQPPASERPSVREMLAEVAPLIDFVPQGGPPVLLVLGPWLFLGLILAGPVAWLFTLVALMIAAATILAALAATLLLAPYLLIRRLRRRRAAHPSISVPAAQLLPLESRRVAA